MEHVQWFKRLTNNDSALSASKKADPPLNNATLSRQLNKGIFSAENVIALARGYGQSPIGELIKTGYLRAEEFTGQSPELAAQLLPDRSLIQELARRIGSDSPEWDKPFDEALRDSFPGS